MIFQKRQQNGGTLSLADQLQLQHKLGPALRERLRVLVAKKGNATWRELQQTGVVVSEKAEGLYQVFGRLSKHKQCTLLRHAEGFFQKAHRAVENDPTLTTEDQAGHAHNAIDCDQVLAAARLARAQRNVIAGTNVLCRFDTPKDGLLAVCIERAESEDANPGFGHQAGIASAFRMRVAAGELFGFPLPANLRAVTANSDNAMKYLGGEDSLDNQAVYRSYLIYLALIQFANRECSAGRAFAKIALHSAKNHGDKNHAVRAWLIMMFGRFGNRVAYALGMLRDEFTS